MQHMPGSGKHRSVLAITAVMLLVGGCSDSSGKGEAEGPVAGVSASKICDGTLDASAAEALHRLAGTDRFDEATGTNEAGEPRTFSLENAVRHLHDEYGKRSACWVYKTSDASGEPLLEIRFSASRGYPSSTEKDSSGDKARYPLGVYAQVGRSGADLFFKCSTKAPSAQAYIADTMYVKAELFSDTAKLRGDSVDKDRIVILNSVSRRVAQEAGCASEASLPAEVPSE
jgi:hypothetical protein